MHFPVPVLQHPFAPSALHSDKHVFGFWATANAITSYINHTAIPTSRGTLSNQATSKKKKKTVGRKFLQILNCWCEPVLQYATTS